MKHVRILLMLSSLVVFAGALLVACDDDDDSGGNGEAATSSPGGGLPANLTKITVSDNKFTPTTLQLPIGATITWEWSGSASHSVVGTFEGEQVESPRLTGTGVFLHAFQKSGVFEYECGVHGAAMSGKVTIQ